MRNSTSNKFQKQEKKIKFKKYQDSEIASVYLKEKEKHTSVPAANFSISNTPIGPFQMIVFEVSNASLNVFIESGPISKPIQPSGILDDGTVCKIAKKKKRKKISNYAMG